MKADNSYFYNMEPVIDLEHFVELLIVSLANKNNNSETKARLFSDYKERIEKAMYSENALSYLQLTNSYHYYEKQINWEISFSSCLEKYLNDKKVIYNFRDDCIEIELSKDEIDKTLEQYDEETKNIMNSFIDSIYTNQDYNSGYDKLVSKKFERNIKRNYIRSRDGMYSNIWTD